MKLLARNMSLSAPLRVSSWRKIAIGTWNRGGDPSVYGILEANVGPLLKYIENLKAKSGARITLSHAVGRIIGEVLKRHPEINCVLRFGRVYPRKTIDVFFQVATDSQGKDLSGMVIRNIRAKGDVDYKKMKDLIGLLPGFFTKMILGFGRIFNLQLNLWSPLMGTPRDAFGSLMLTNIGSLGLDLAFAPLVPYSGIPLLVAVGAVEMKPVAKPNGDGFSVGVAPLMKLCVTFDHRIIDGIHAAKMTKTLKAIFANPDAELGS